MTASMPAACVPLALSKASTAIGFWASSCLEECGAEQTGDAGGLQGEMGIQPSSPSPSMSATSQGGSRVRAATARAACPFHRLDPSSCVAQVPLPDFQRVLISRSATPRLLELHAG